MSPVNNPDIILYSGQTALHDDNLGLRENDPHDLAEAEDQRNEGKQ